MQGQERVEVITRGDVTPKESFLEKMKGDFLAVPYFTERTGDRNFSSPAMFHMGRACRR